VIVGLVRQFHHPRGIAGGVVGWVMAHRRSNVERNRWVVSLLDVQPADRVLEIGFGPGIAIAAIAARATRGQVYGVDHSEVMVRQAGRRNAAAVREGRVHLTHAGVDRLPAFDGPLDAILAVNSLGFWREPVERLRELRGLLRTGGRDETGLAHRFRGDCAYQGSASRSRGVTGSHRLPVLVGSYWMPGGAREPFSDELVKPLPGGTVNPAVTDDHLDGLSGKLREGREVRRQRHALSQVHRCVRERIQSGVVGLPVDRFIVGALDCDVLLIVQQRGAVGEVGTSEVRGERVDEDPAVADCAFAALGQAECPEPCHVVHGLGRQAEPVRLVELAQLNAAGLEFADADAQLGVDAVDLAGNLSGVGVEDVGDACQGHAGLGERDDAGEVDHGFGVVVPVSGVVSSRFR
jgi:SAM-dependent methyltransferase